MLWGFYVLFAALMIILSARVSYYNGRDKGRSEVSAETMRIAYDAQRYYTLYLEQLEEADQLRAVYYKLLMSSAFTTPTEGQAEDAPKPPLLGSLPSLGNTPSKWGSS